MKKLIALTLLAAGLAGPVSAEPMNGKELSGFMSSNGKSMRFSAGSVASFSGGKVTMKHQGSAALTGTYSVSSKGVVTMKLSDGSQHAFRVEKEKKSGSYPYELTYTKGPYRGRSFTFK
ncbi:hypothetical protein [Roseibium suaedae]|uniref:DUF3108 domain-containing protein n=1 Tax=Roseibium suaedae TaxID=735517 RepID=A0A1M7HMM4_9HYPH|nr:hypothetical protein [Roseibium suaedae]SHM29583.1 hypothetical protein SAMN05444272_2268 [Roseibium suaedae]